MIAELPSAVPSAVELSGYDKLGAVAISVGCLIALMAFLWWQARGQSRRDERFFGFVEKQTTAITQNTDTVNAALENQKTLHALMDRVLSCPKVNCPVIRRDDVTPNPESEEFKRDMEDWRLERAQKRLGLPPGTSPATA